MVHLEPAELIPIRPPVRLNWERMYKLLKIDPVSKPRMTQRDRWKVRTCVKKYRDFCDRLRMFKMNVDWEDLQVTFRIPMPNSWSVKKKSEMNRTPHKQRPDIDNILKGFMDALLKEDSSVWRVNTSKMWGYDGDIVVKCKD